MSVFGKICSIYRLFVRVCEHFLSPVLDLAVRLYMAGIFFPSGWSKFMNFVNGDWGTTVFLFTDVHPIPGLPPEIAAVMGTAGEVGLSILLALGLGGRFAAAGLLVMTIVIQFLVPAEYELMNSMHYLWMLLLAVTLVKGPGPLSLDYVGSRLILKKRS